MLTALILCRFAHFAATMLLFGASAFVWALAPAGLARDLTGAVRRIAAVAVVVAAITALIWLGLEAGSMGEGWSDVLNPDMLAGVLTDTAFGRVWQWRLGLVLVFLVALAAGRHDRWAFIAPASALLLASLGLAGHAIMQTGPVGALHRVNDALHLLVAGAWVGGLVPFVLCVNRFGDPALRSEALLATRRYSTWGHLVVAIVVLTGVVNVALTLHVAPIPFTTPYQTLLAAKIVMVVTMIAMALFNRYVLVPRLKDETGRAARALKINSIAEIACAFIVVALVSAFGLLQPN
ncbi:MAG: copper homeostasis membrane protein CopD [Roseiarcus sp.]